MKELSKLRWERVNLGENLRYCDVMRCILIEKHVVISLGTHEISCAGATSVQFQTPKHIIAIKLSGCR